MVKIPYIKIPGVRVGSIGPASNIGTGGATPTPPTPITYLTQWKIVGNSEVHTLPYPDGVVLPTGYKRCEYLIFDGSSYINTGIKTANGVGVRTSFETTTSLKQVFGTRQNGTNYGIIFGFLGYQGSNNAISGYFSSANITTFKNPMYDGNKHSVQLDSENFIVDGIEYSITRNSETGSSLDITIGALNNNGNIDNRIFVGNIYDTIIYNTQGELWHGIPCLDANDVPCFYDIVSQTAFYNQGSGSFTYKLYPQPTEIWSCGEYNATDGKYHILVQPLGGNIADIALDAPLRKVNDVADTIEFPSETEGKALVVRNFSSLLIGNAGNIVPVGTNTTDVKRMGLYSVPVKPVASNGYIANILCSVFEAKTANGTYLCQKGISVSTSGYIQIYDPNYNTASDIDNFKTAYANTEIIYELVTPTTELVDAPQIEEADSYTCVISQGGKAVSWYSFTTNSE